MGTFGADANGEATNGMNHEGESTNAAPRGGTPRSSGEVGESRGSEGGVCSEATSVPIRESLEAAMVIVDRDHSVPWPWSSLTGTLWFICLVALGSVEMSSAVVDLLAEGRVGGEASGRFFAVPATNRTLDYYGNSACVSGREGLACRT